MMPPAALVEKAVERAPHVDLTAFVGRFFCIHFYSKDTGLIFEQQVIAGIPTDDFTPDRYQGRLGWFDTHHICLSLLRLRMLALIVGFRLICKIYRQTKYGRRETVTLDYLAPPV
jgi:hypothetical protein